MNTANRQTSDTNTHAASTGKLVVKSLQTQLSLQSVFPSACAQMHQQKQQQQVNSFSNQLLRSTVRLFKQTDRQTDRQPDRHTKTHTHACMQFGASFVHYYY